MVEREGNGKGESIIEKYGRSVAAFSLAVQAAVCGVLDSGHFHRAHRRGLEIVFFDGLPVGLAVFFGGVDTIAETVRHGGS